LIAFYGIVLGFGAKILSDGSEEMLELFPKWGTVIGALLLPILGAVPDAAIIIASGALGSDPQGQLAVGVGTLAGSTIMLLTIPWAASMIIARCDMNDLGEAMDKKCHGFSFTKQCVSVDQDTPINARIMLGTSLAYFIVQGIAFAYLYDPSGKAAHKSEHYFAIAGFVICVVCLLSYCIYQIFVPKLAEKRKEKLDKEREERNLKLRALHILHKWTPNLARSSQPAEEKNPLVSLLGTPAPSENAHAKALQLGMKWKKKAADKKEEEPLLDSEKANIQDEEDDSDDEKEEEEPSKNFCKNLTKAIVLLAIGTAVVAIFSDPMVDVIGDFAVSIKVKPFFVSFLITPFCSNASELISSLIFAAKKKKTNASLTFSQLYGAATMNNTLCLGIFFALIFFRGLVWEYTAETLSILLVTWIVGFIAAFRVNFRIYWAVVVILLYPLSLLFVWGLEYGVHWA